MNIETPKNDNLSKYLIEKLNEVKPAWLLGINFKKNQDEDSYFIDLDLKFLSKGFQTFLLTTEGMNYPFLRTFSIRTFTGLR
ncbi:hypothetical protein LEP1GSC043_3272 [Leptospira weilii str. Ecochallenge]|uniref:Uncharacterized protein n=1 Tax=Leptospira weilii str. Ecochallenge TaxID=1049986 RepID=N1U746_9LEPT|nr:hypothetical protein LEP1GSC043_3272 [Leptospira weilii str. Ecochallenge]